MRKRPLSAERRLRVVRHLQIVGQRADRATGRLVCADPDLVASGRKLELRNQPDSRLVDALARLRHEVQVERLAVTALHPARADPPRRSRLPPIRRTRHCLLHLAKPTINLDGHEHLTLVFGAPQRSGEHPERQIADRNGLAQRGPQRRRRARFRRRPRRARAIALVSGGRNPCRARTCRPGRFTLHFDPQEAVARPLRRVAVVAEQVVAAVVEDDPAEPSGQVAGIDDRRCLRFPRTGRSGSPARAAARAAGRGTCRSRAADSPTRSLISIISPNWLMPRGSMP